MTRSTNLGFPRIGLHRELKTSLESFWKGDITAAALNDTARALRARHWHLQREAGIDIIPSNDFSFYDHVLDTSILLGAIPPRFAGIADADQRYFAMARGTDAAPAMEMTKWFDTNYHFIVPELHTGQSFTLNADKPLAHYREAKALGLSTRPVLVGPVTFLSLAKARDDGLDTLDLLDAVLPIYADLLGQLAAEGVEWVQMDEPVLVLDLSEKQQASFVRAYDRLGAVGPKLLLATYFGALRDNTELAAKLPVAGLHIDLVRAPEQLDAVLAVLPEHKTLSVGVVDGRNIWRTDLDQAFGVISRAWDQIGPERLEIAPSCSLLHAPVDLAGEIALDAELRSWLAFGKQKLEEVTALTLAMQKGKPAAKSAFDASAACIAAHKASPRIHKSAVTARAAEAIALDRGSPFPSRRDKQRRRFKLPAYPTTTIGSFPQTREVARRGLPSGRARSTRRDTTPSSRQKPGRSSASRKSSTSTCWCMASSSVMTWWSISANSLTALPSPGMAGCSPTARAASSRR